MTTTTPTSSAADLRATFSEMLVDLPNTEPYTLFQAGFDAALAAGQATVAQAVVQDDLITIRKPTTKAEMLWLLKLAHLVISDVDKTLEETFSPAQPAAQQGAAYAALPDEVVRLAQVAIRECQYKGNDMPQDWMESAMRACRLIAASHGQAPAGAGMGHTDGGRNMFYDGRFDGESQREQQARLRWANDMRAAFERHTGNGWFDKDWRTETGLWSSAWHACLAAQPSTTAQAAESDSVQEDAALWHWLAEYLVGTRTDLDDEIVASETVNDLRKLVEAAIKQGATK